MLVITRKAGEAFYIGSDVCVTVEDIRGDKIRISINAPREITILRKELSDAQDVNAESASPDLSIVKRLINPSGQ